MAKRRSDQNIRPRKTIKEILEDSEITVEFSSTAEDPDSAVKDNSTVEDSETMTRNHSVVEDSDTLTKSHSVVEDSEVIVEDDSYLQDTTTENYDDCNFTVEDAENLSVDERFYEVLEYIDLEWPSMSVDALGSKVITATCPPNSKYIGDLVEISFSDFTPMGIKHSVFKEHPIPWNFNKIRINNGIFGMSQKLIVKFNWKFDAIKVAKGDYRFGLCVSPQYVMAGCCSGEFEIYDHELNLIRRVAGGKKPVECIGFDSQTHPSVVEALLRHPFSPVERPSSNPMPGSPTGRPGLRFLSIDPLKITFSANVPNGIIATGSLDHNVRLYSTEGNLIGLIYNDSEINSLDIRKGHLVFGDDNGLLHLVDLRAGKLKHIKWHKSAISFVRWKDDDVFLSGSDEQVCIWDKSIVDENDDEEDPNSRIPKNLMFVHQGQSFYKDCAFCGNAIILTSHGGLCIFEQNSSYH